METVEMDGGELDEVFAKMDMRLSELRREDTSLREGEFTTDMYAKSKALSLSRSQSILREMQTLGILESRWASIGGGRRKVYRYVEKENGRSISK